MDDDTNAVTGESSASEAPNSSPWLLEAVDVQAPPAEDEGASFTCSTCGMCSCGCSCGS